MKATTAALLFLAHLAAALPVAIAAYSDASCGKNGGKVVAARGLATEEKRTTQCITTKEDQAAKSVIITMLAYRLSAATVGQMRE